MELKDKASLATLVVHGGEERGKACPPASFTPVSPPIYHSVAYGYPSMQDLDDVFSGSKSGYCYSRFGNPTVCQFEKAMAAVEGGDICVAFASGMAAIHACFSLCNPAPGSAVLASRDLYGPTYLSLRDFCAERGVCVEYVDCTDLNLVARRMAELSPIFFMVETISNPLVRVADLQSIGAITRAHGCTLVVDNTFATPVLCRPLALGADIVVHSATKFIGGHGDVMGGVVITDKARAQRLSEIRKMTGAILGPQDAWLLTRSLKTLLVRVERQLQNAVQVASWLQAHPRINTVHFPGLAGHAQHTLACTQFGNQGKFGSMLSFEIKDTGKREMFSFFDKLRLCLPVTTLGDVFTLALYPAYSSHRGLTRQQREELGIKENLVRLSIGIEDAHDICADLAAALQDLPPGGTRDDNGSMSGSQYRSGEEV